MELKLLSIGIVALLFYGWSQRFRPRIHIPVMLTAFVLDMALVVYIEMNRHAVNTALGATPGIMKIHLLFSFGTVILYVVQIVSGFIRYKRGGMPYHKHTGVAFMVCRIGNLMTSFLIPTTG